MGIETGHYIQDIDFQKLVGTLDVTDVEWIDLPDNSENENANICAKRAIVLLYMGYSFMKSRFVFDK